MSTDPGPFERVYDAHAVGIYRFLYARVGNHPDAEDLTAQVFVRAVEQLDTEREPGQVAAWLYRVAHNAAADYWRAFYRLPIVGVDHVAPGWEPADEGSRPQLEPDERAAARVQGLLRRLPDQYRRVLELRFLERLSVAETAHAMGISNGNARVLQYRALRRAALLGDRADG
ncbi:MAG TPA: sigma-70 family RNA polymerase sigma factor [Candidatus Limnocylindria bacterium]|jgi:RNA polymerase sigma-70 factor (ECF subfamily)|nr:sigma-70 family RNA polymerase sigma factor [Candidatus Limnocylindria bacterium]